jgi:cell division transport system permease protein
MPIFKNLKTAWEYIRRNKWLTVTNILVMTLTFFLTSIFAIAAYGSNFILDALEQRPQVTAYFRDEATEMEILAVKEKLEVTGLTSEVKYVSKEEALNIFMGLSQKNPALLEGISANVLPASLEVRAKNLNDLPTLAQMLEGEPLLEDLQFFRDVVEKFRRLTDTARLLGLGMVSLLTVISILIVLITISITIASRGEEIEIMRLVGASDWQIRGPFLFQGAVLGIVSAVLSLVLTFALFPLVRPQLVGALGSLPVPQLSLVFSISLVLGEIFLGMLIGSVGSWVAVRKYLRT